MTEDRWSQVGFAGDGVRAGARETVLPGPSFQGPRWKTHLKHRLKGG